MHNYLILPLWYELLLAHTNLAAEKLTVFILCSARKKLANLLTFAVLNHSIQVYLSAFKRIREPDVWNWTQFLEYFYLLDQKHDFWPLNLLVFRLTVLFQEQSSRRSSIQRVANYLTNPDVVSWQKRESEFSTVPSWFYQRSLQNSNLEFSRLFSSFFTKLFCLVQSFIKRFFFQNRNETQ